MTACSLLLLWFHQIPSQPKRHFSGSGNQKSIQLADTEFFLILLGVEQGQKAGVQLYFTE